MPFLNYDMNGVRITADNFDTVINAVVVHCIEHFYLFPETVIFGDAMLPLFEQIFERIVQRYHIRVNDAELQQRADGEIGRYATNYGIVKLVHERGLGNLDIIITHANNPGYKPALIHNFRL